MFKNNAAFKTDIKSCPLALIRAKLMPVKLANRECVMNTATRGCQRTKYTDRKVVVVNQLLPHLK